MPLRGFVQMDQILISNVRDGIAHSCLYPWEATSTGGAQCTWGVVCYAHRVLCPWRIISVTGYLFVMDCVLWFYTHSLAHSVTLSLKTNPGLILDRSDVIRIFTLKNKISNKRYCCHTFAKTAHTNHKTMWCTIMTYPLLNILYLIWWNVFTQ